MPYELVVDGQVLDLGERQYLLSPQDLSGLEVLPDLLRTGLACFKIEGRLKSPEYVANVTRVYRQAIDRCLSAQSAELLQHQADSRYRLEMAFSRGLYTGWFRGIDNQALVHGRFGKKRGVYLGQVTGVDRDRQRLLLQPEAPLKPGDGVVFDQGHPDRAEEGGRIYGVEETEWGTVLWFGKGDLNWRRLQVGDRVWKTSDPELERELRQSFAGDQPRFARSLQVEVAGQVGEPLRVTAEDEQGHQVAVESEMLLVKAERQPLTTERLREQLGRLGNTPFYLAELLNHLQGEVLIPVRELNRLRREMVVQLEALRTVPRGWTLRFSCEDAARTSVSYRDLLPTEISNVAIGSPELIVLVRNLAQLEAVLDLNIATIYCEFEDPRRYREAVERVRRDRSPLKPLSVWVAPPRITKPGEQWILEQVQKAGADGYLIRNYDHLDFFAKGTSPLDKRCRGDFSLNVANGLTAAYFKEQFGLERLTVSYDLNRAQLEGLLRQAPPDWFEVTIHQHMPLFHMEHCVFCAFLSTGQDYRNCGRPCEQYGVKLRDGLRPAFGHRTHTEHLLQADAGCRNTVFNGRAQTGAEAVQGLLRLGLRHFRVEFLQETPDQVRETTRAYQALLAGEMTGTELWQQLKLQSQLGVTRGSFEG
jgi:putative protease